MLRTILRLPLTFTINVMVNLASMGIVLFGGLVILGLETARLCDKGLELLENSQQPNLNPQPPSTPKPDSAQPHDSDWIIVPDTNTNTNTNTNKKKRRSV